MSSPARIVTGREPFVKQIGFWTLVLPILAVLGVLILAAREGAPTTVERERPSGDTLTEIIFAGNPESFAADSAAAFADLALFQQDIVVLGAEAQSDQVVSPTDAAKRHADRVLVTEIQDQGWYQINDVVVIVLDVAVTGSGSCELDPEQLDMLRGAVRADATHRILFMSDAPWARSGYVPGLTPEAQTPCNGDYWQEQILPIIEGKVALVASGAGGGVTPFGVTERDGIRYLLTGNAANPSASGPALITMARIQARGGQLLADRLTLGASSKLETDAIGDVPTYTVTVSEPDLERLYRTAPFYDFGTDWQLKIEPDAVLSWLQDSIEGTLDTESGSVPVAFAIRGNVGNHWETYKKSWDIDFVDDLRIKRVVRVLAHQAAAQARGARCQVLPLQQHHPARGQAR